ncbi:MAG: hypothetical protein IKP74_08315, partial [Clostridia bacterium]|nr:hypothetical protein [Clostridia bacterium]
MPSARLYIERNGGKPLPSRQAVTPPPKVEAPEKSAPYIEPPASFDAGGVFYSATVSSAADFSAAEI